MTHGRNAALCALFSNVNVQIANRVTQSTRITASTLRAFGVLCCDPPHTGLLSGARSLSLTQRVGRMDRSLSVNS